MATETESDDLLRRYRFWAEEFYDHVIFKEDETQSPESPLLSAAGINSLLAYVATVVD